MNDDLLRLARLYEKYTNGNCTPEERTEFMALVNRDESVDELNRLIEKDVEDNRQEKILAGPRANQLYDLILEKAKKQEYYSRPMSKVFILRRVVAAASVIFLLGFGIYFLLNNTNEKTTIVKDAGLQSSSKNDVAPGGNKAILTLADGSTIVLDTATSGILAEQGGTKVVKQENGELTYNSSDVDGGKVLYNTISTPRGGQYQLVLSDGSKVWLNSASSLRFPATFSGNVRKVELSGEAYFEVAKNTKMPFKVNVPVGKSGKDMQIEVLGTHFNVNAYNDEPSVKTTLLEGSVKVVNQSFSTVHLTPGQQSQLIDNTLSVMKNVDIDKVMSWKTGFFEFDNTDLQSVMRQISRWYNVDVIFDGKKSMETFGGRISKDLNLSKILGMLEENGVKFRFDGKILIVQP